MRTWEYVEYTNTFRELVDKINKNTDSSNFIDNITGTILCNGVMFEGNETVDGQKIYPLENVTLSGIVNSNTIFDNFKLYFRDNNIIVELDQFPIDLLSYLDNKIHFLFIKPDLSYRVSDYMFGGADELLLARFVINTDGTWNQLYIMAPRAGTPEYDAAEEFYNVNGLFVKSPGGLELSQTSGSVKRSGIEFTDKLSPDYKKFYNLSSERVPLRYVNIYNEIDYTQPITYNVITDKYMTYNMNKKLKIEAEQKIQDIQNMYYGIQKICNNVSNELNTAILSGGDLSDLTLIVKSFTNYIDGIYTQVDNLYNMLGDITLSSVRRADLLTNKNDINDFMDTYLKGSAIETAITNIQVLAIINIASYIKHISIEVYDLPLEDVLQEIQDDLNEISYDTGALYDVPEGKFTLQRILWDIYDNCLIMQYGDTVYDSFEDAAEGTSLLPYPAPWGKTIYIPLAILLVKSGISSINDDDETIIIDRRNIYVDQESSDFIDYVARARASKAIALYVPNLHIPVTINASNWVASNSYSGFYEYTIENVNIKAEPYIIDLVIRNTQDLKADVVALPSGAQSVGSIKIMTKVKPTVNLDAFLIIQKGETV